MAQCRARNTPTVAATIGGRPASPDFETYVQRYSGNGIVKGLRQVLHGSTPAGYCLRPDFVRGVQTLGKHGLNFELTMRPTELQDAVKLIPAVPGDPLRPRSLRQRRPQGLQSQTRPRFETQLHR